MFFPIELPEFSSDENEDVEMKDENPKEIVADSKDLSEQILGKVRKENFNCETSYKNENVHQGPNAEKRLKQIPITNFFKQSEKDVTKLDEKPVKTSSNTPVSDEKLVITDLILPKLDEKLFESDLISPKPEENIVKTLNVQPKENLENQSPIRVENSNEEKPTKRKGPKLSLHVPWKISSNIEGIKTCKICGLVGIKPHDTYRHILNVHLKSKLFQCNNCDFGTKRIGVLRVHFNTAHANEKCKQTADNFRENDFTKKIDDIVAVDTTKPSGTIKEDVTMYLETKKQIASKYTETANKNTKKVVDLDNLNIGTLELKQENQSITNLKNESENIDENETNEDLIDPMSVVKVELVTEQNDTTEQEAVKSNLEIPSESITDGSKTVNNEGLLSLPPLFECKSCKNIFLDPGSLENHIKIAHGVQKESKKYSCNYCDKSYKQNQTLKIHIKKVHPNQKSKQLADIEKFREIDFTEKVETKSQEMETPTSMVIQKGQIDIIEKNDGTLEKNIPSVFKCLKNPFPNLAKKICQKIFNTEQDLKVHMAQDHFEFTSDQVEQLEKLFSFKKFINIFEIEKLSKMGNYPEDKVQQWFQNRRLKAESHKCDHCEKVFHTRNEFHNSF